MFEIEAFSCAVQFYTIKPFITSSPVGRLARMAANTALLLLLLSTARAGRHERRLLNDLLFSYNSMELSANNEADSVDCIVDFK